MALLILRQFVGRLAVAVPMLLAVTFGAFLLLYQIGDPAAAMAGDGANSEQIQQIREENGLDRPVIVQYLSWLGNFVQGDLGESMQNRGDVQHLVGQYLPPTLLLSALAMGIAVLAALAGA